MNILILGGAGFIGINLVRKIFEKGKHHLTVVDSLDPTFKSNLKNLKELLPKITFIKGDIRNKKLISKFVKNQQAIINCAAQTSHPFSLKDPLFDTEINCLGNLTVLESIKNNSPKAKLIFVSSSTLIGKADGETVDETHGEKPLDIYSANKGVAEKYYYIYNRVYGLKTVSLRFSNIYGPYGKHSSDFGFINYFIDCVYHNKKIPIYGSGKQMRNVMYVEDACELLYKSIFSNNIYGDSYFAVHREHYSIFDIAKTIISVFGKGEIKKIPWPVVRKKIEIDNVYISGAKLFYKIKWEPKYNLREGLIKTKQIMDKNNL
ncbi:NAD-dependent epimerase/dehydratase family protein [Candidatus Roizmanbacteria bacterium]|nr:NAD-dependent epimerase/dehydratase family protein [Candidatus Roizmanbacteria bacterium]